MVKEQLQKYFFKQNTNNTFVQIRGVDNDCFCLGLWTDTVQISK